MTTHKLNFTPAIQEKLTLNLIILENNNDSNNHSFYLNDTMVLVCITLEKLKSKQNNIVIQLEYLYNILYLCKFLKLIKPKYEFIMDEYIWIKNVKDLFNDMEKYFQVLVDYKTNNLLLNIKPIYKWESIQRVLKIRNDLNIKSTILYKFINNFHSSWDLEGLAHVAWLISEYNVCSGKGAHLLLNKKISKKYWSFQKVKCWFEHCQQSMNYK